MNNQKSECVDIIKTTEKKLNEKISNDIIKKWKPIKNYENIYEISTEGQIRSVKTGKFLNTLNKSTKYSIVSLSKNGIPKSFYVHLLVAESFLESPKCCTMCGTKFEINHINQNRYDNRVENLEYVTHQKNIELSLEKRQKCNWNKKLTDKQVLEIKNMLDKKMTLKNISKKFKVSISTIHKISKGISRKYLTQNKNNTILS